MANIKSITEINCYLVDGAIRNQLLNLSIYDKD